MEIEKQISKELSTEVGFDPATLKVIFDMSYKGKYLESDLKNRVALVNLIEVIVKESTNKIDDAIFALLVKLLEMLKKA